MEALVSYIEYYLPVFIPVLLSLLSIFAGLLTGRIALTFGSLLKTHSDLVLGLFSFIIWAFVVNHQTGKINLNPDYSIGVIRIVLLLFADIFFLVLGAILLKQQWAPSPKWPWLSAHRKENVFNGLFLMLTLVLVFAPVALKTPEPKVAATATFRVGVAYFDDSIAKQIGIGRWEDRILCEIVEAKARDQKEAVEHAITQFEESGKFKRLISSKAEMRHVTIIRDRILVQRQ